ncbi:Oxidoreductase-like protein N-terminal family protein [Acanthocheilonema viteae]
MRRVFTVASKKNPLSPYFLCMRWRVDKKLDYNRGLDSEDELLGSGRMATSSRVKTTTSDRIVHQSCPPEPPDPATCCGFGCANCVWVEYVTELMRYYSGRPLHEILIEIDRVVPNVSVREFIKAEVRARVKCHH